LIDNMIERIINNKLITIIKAAFDLPYDLVDVSADEVKTLEVIAAKQSIIPIFKEGLKKMGYLDLLSESAIKSDAKCVYDYTQRKSSLDEISDVFDRASIQYVPLKGAVICEYYPQPWMRSSSDIDVLIHEDDLDKAKKLLNTQSSFEYTNREQYDANFVNQYVHLELHFSLESSVVKIDNALNDPWKHIVQTNNSYRCSFTPEYNLFYILSHSAKHFIHNGGIGIRPILDIYVMKSHMEIDENKVIEFCEDAGIKGFYNECCKLLDVWFNGANHDEVSRIFEDLVISGGVFGSKHLKIVSNKRKDSGKKYIRGRIFKTSEEIKNFHPRCRKYPVLIPFYQIVRWTQVAKARRPKEVLSEFKQADSIDKAEVEKYDKLMKAMGL